MTMVDGEQGRVEPLDAADDDTDTDGESTVDGRVTRKERPAGWGQSSSASGSKSSTRDDSGRVSAEESGASA
jgi:hypothetical protein